MKKSCFVLLLLCALSAQAQVTDDIYATKQGDDVQLSVITPAKPDKSTKQEPKAREKRLKERVDSLGHAKAGAALERGYWVILADRVSVGYTGYTASGLNGNSNFIFQQAGEGMVQTAFNQASPGLNGMGGMTLQGNVSGVKMRVDKKGNIRYTYSMTGEDISAQIDITVYAGTDYAQAIVEPTFSGPRLTINGRLLPYIRPRH